MKYKKKLEEKLEKKREEMRRYRERKREQGFSKKRGSLPMLPTPKQQAAKKREKKKKDRVRKGAKTELQQLEAERRKLAVKRTQVWRMRIKMLQNKKKRFPDMNMMK